MESREEIKQMEEQVKLEEWKIKHHTSELALAKLRHQMFEEKLALVKEGCDV